MMQTMISDHDSVRGRIEVYTLDTEPMSPSPRCSILSWIAKWVKFQHGAVSSLKRRNRCYGKFMTETFYMSMRYICGEARPNDYMDQYVETELKRMVAVVISYERECWGGNARSLTWPMKTLRHSSELAAWALVSTVFKPNHIREPCAYECLRVLVHSCPGFVGKSEGSMQRGAQNSNRAAATVRSLRRIQTDINEKGWTTQTYL